MSLNRVWGGRLVDSRRTGYIQGTGYDGLTVSGSAHRIQCKAASFWLQMGEEEKGSVKLPTLKPSKP